jgi:hypothetical protein
MKIINKKEEEVAQRTQEENILESIPEIILTIASGATPIESAGRTPDEILV